MLQQIAEDDVGEVEQVLPAHKQMARCGLAFFSLLRAQLNDLNRQVQHSINQCPRKLQFPLYFLLQAN